jgi:L-ribulose-5-phosphate 4-epimerase
MHSSDQNQSFEPCLKEFLEIAHRAALLGLQAGTGGNISARCGSNFLMKATRKSLYGMTEADVVLVDAEGRVVRGSTPPTKEAGLHLNLYRLRPEVQGIVHYHAPFASAYAIKGLPIPIFSDHARRAFPRMPIVPELRDGSPELAQAVEKAFQDREVKLVLLAAHGLVAVGDSLLAAQTLAELAEETAKTAVAVRLLQRL